VLAESAGAKVLENDYYTFFQHFVKVGSPLPSPPSFSIDSTSRFAARFD
jgi:hypothetical protein